MEFAGGKILAEIDGAAGWLIVNQPERMNAVNYEMWQAIPQALAWLGAHDALRAIVLRGAGDRAFAAGADISEFDEVRCDSRTNAVFTEAVTQATSSLLEFPAPVIAMISGYCIGGGMVLSSACDLRICDDGSQFGVPAAKLGLAYELDNYARLSRIVGSGFAQELLFTGRKFSAAEALAMRFVNRVVAPAELEGTIAGYLDDIRQNAPLTLAAAKLSERSVRDASLSGDAQRAIDACFDSEDFKEGRQAFQAKRSPRFVGR